MISPVVEEGCRQGSSHSGNNHLVEKSEEEEVENWSKLTHRSSVITLIPNG